MHVYTLVRLSLNQIGFLIVKLRPLDYLIVSRIKRACQWRLVVFKLREEGLRTLLPLACLHCQWRMVA